MATILQYFGLVTPGADPGEGRDSNDPDRGAELDLLDRDSEKVPPEPSEVERFKRQQAL